MSDDKPENQEFYASNEVNDFHSSAAPKELSASTDNSEKTAEQTVPSSLPATAGILTTGAVATAAVTVGVLVGKPLLQNLPQIDLLEANSTSTSVSYSFQCTYVSSGNLTVRLTSALEEKSVSYPLEVSEISSSNSLLSVPDSSLDSSSSSSSSYTKTIQGTFAGLSPKTSYALTILSPLTENTMTTLKSQTVLTGTEPLVAPSVSFLTTEVQYSSSQLTYTLAVTDPSSTLDSKSFYIQAIGLDSTGASVTQKEALSGSLTDGQTLSLAIFTKGNVLRLSVWGITSYVKEGDSAVSTPQKFVEMALYY
jgi:hypothetical protein